MTLTRTTPEVMVRVPSGTVELPGMLSIPKNATSLVIFAHGSGSSHTSERNIFVSNILQSSGIATLLFDLLTPDEDALFKTRFNIPLLTKRLKDATKWLWEELNMQQYPTGYFGASTGAGAALKAAAGFGSKIGAVVSRGGRPDLAGPALKKVMAPTLLIVGSNDHPVIPVNQRAYLELNDTKEKELHIVDGATHLFDEPGALKEVAMLSALWFSRHL